VKIRRAIKYPTWLIDVGGKDDLLAPHIGKIPENIIIGITRLN